VLIALAGGCLLLDQVFGYSSSWMRYRLAELQLRKLIRVFSLDTQAEFAKLPDQTVPADQADRIIAQIKAFITEASNVVISETETWVAEFKSGLLKREQITKVGGKNGNV
jgi:hypothetical protein